MREIEGKVAMEAMSECGQRASFKAVATPLCGVFVRVFRWEIDAIAIVTTSACGKVHASRAVASCEGGSNAD